MRRLEYGKVFEPNDSALRPDVKGVPAALGLERFTKNVLIHLAKLLLGRSRPAGAGVSAGRGRIDRPRMAVFPLWHPGHRATLRPPRRSRARVTNRPAGRDPARCRDRGIRRPSQAPSGQRVFRAADGRENAIARAMVYVFAAFARSVRVDTRPGIRRTGGACPPATEPPRRRRPRGADERGRRGRALRAETLERLKAYEPTATTAASDRPRAPARLPHCRPPAAAAGSEQPPSSPSGDPWNQESLYRRCFRNGSAG